MRTLLALALVPLPAFAAPVPREVKRPILEQIQGKWVLVSYDMGTGHRAPDGLIGNMTLTLERDKYKQVGADDVDPGFATLVYNSKADPIQVDAIANPELILPGIIKLDGGRLYWCQTMPDKPRPTEFKGGGDTFCFIYKRAGK